MPKKPKVSIKIHYKLWPPAVWISSLALILSSIIIAVIIFIVTIHFLFSDKIYPGISVAGIDLSGLSSDQAQFKLNNDINARLQKKILLFYQNSSSSAEQKLEVDLADNQNLDFTTSINLAFSFGRSQFYFWPVNILLADNQNFDQDINKLANQVDQPAIDSELVISDDQVSVTPSQSGLVVNKTALKNYLTTYINTDVFPNQELPLQKSEPKLSYSAALKIKNRLDQIKLNPVKLTYQDQSFVLELKDVLPLIDLQNSQTTVVSGQIGDQNFTVSSIKFGDNQISDTKLALNPQKTNDFIQSIAQKIDRPVKEPLFNFDPSSPNRIKQFQPPTEGKILDRQKTFNLITQALVTDDQNNITLPVQTVGPKNTLANDLGIKELIGHGESNFGGSIENRIFNVKLAASRLNGVLVPPGEVFSFNNTNGDVTAATGYKQAYVIKSGRTVLDDGGGVCQVSTTLFRAVLNSGLPVVSRTAHAYRVHYYENGGYPPGIDATTYYPSVDFKFKNDTDRHILIQAYSEGLNLFVDLYGTSDGRVATVTKPIIASQTPPPPELRQDDPTLPKGTVKQVDFSAWGANVNFKRTVVKNGLTIINESFQSNYRPWQAIFLVGTKEG